MGYLKYILAQLFLIFTIGLYAQSLTGTTGLLNTPSADMQADGTFMMGANYLPAINQPSLDYPTANYYFNLTFLPFLEVAYKFTLLRMDNNLQDKEGRYTNQDRSINLRVQVAKELRIRPAITIGIHDLLTTVKSGNQYYGATYITATKHFSLKSSIIGLTSGYGIKALHHNQFIGLFGGISIQPGFSKVSTFVIEYDTGGINWGGSLIIFRHLHLLAMMQRSEYFTGGIAFRTQLRIDR